MKRGWIGLAMGAMVALGAFLSLPSCGHNQQVVSLMITPAAFTFLTNTPGQGNAEQYTAMATYIHPPATKDVTSQATWAVDYGIVTINAGLVSPVGGSSCGGATITATVPQGTGGASNIVSAYATVTVDDPSISTCPGGNTEGTLSVQITPNGSGTVTSSTYGINCPSVSCISVVPVGASVALTATPNSGYSFLNWLGCTTTQANSCLVTIPSGGVGLIATFQPN